MNVTFDYYLGDNRLEIEAEVTPGRPAHTNCLPEDAYPAEPDEVEIVSVHIVDEHGGNFEFDTSAISIRPWASAKLRCLDDVLIETAVEESRQ